MQDLDAGPVEALRRGPRKTVDLLARLSISQATLSRRLAPLLRAGQVVKIGRARATTYGLVRGGPGIPREPLPLYEIDPGGKPHKRAELVPLVPEGSAVLADRDVSFPWNVRLYNSLPFFLEYLRPEGFLGRALVQSVVGALSLPGNARDWTEDNLLLFLTRAGEDLPGACIVGSQSLERFLEKQFESVPAEARLYRVLADRALAGETPGSSAGGEQPKFTVFVGDAKKREFHAIVKFSPSEKSQVALRWRDLLIAEFFALRVLAENDLPASRVELLMEEGRAFLQIERFDRVGEKGRRPYISMGCLDDEFIGNRDHIRSSAARLTRAGLLDESDRKTIVTTSLFGDFIGNTDQHFGNVSFSWNETGIFLAPLYDILPMWYAPGSQGQIVNEPHRLPPGLPEQEAEFTRARAMALEFWRRVGDDPRISAEFRRIAGKNEKRIRLILN